MRHGYLSNKDSALPFLMAVRVVLAALLAFDPRRSGVGGSANGRPGVAYACGTARRACRSLVDGADAALMPLTLPRRHTSGGGGPPLALAASENGFAFAHSPSPADVATLGRRLSAPPPCGCVADVKTEFVEKDTARPHGVCFGRGGPVGASSVSGTPQPSIAGSRRIASRSCRETTCENDWMTSTDVSVQLSPIQNTGGHMRSFLPEMGTMIIATAWHSKMRLV